MNDSKLYDTKQSAERAVLIGVDTENSIFSIDSSLDELDELAKTAGAVTVGRMVQKREGIHRAHYFGKGKLDELKAYIDELNADTVICDDELSPVQIRNLKNILDVKILNRTLVILDIFASRASSAEGKVQVELAQLKYNLSHLTGQGISMSRLGGGIGTRGPGEKKLETDRRNIADRIAELNRELKEIEKHRQIIRDKRIKKGIPIIALAGYTNAGKSTLMNYITNAAVLAENKLFATLDTTTRKIQLSSGADYLFVDTVGFIQKLPHNLIKAFRATLEELKFADVIIHVVDASNPAREQQMKIVYDTFRELQCMDKPIITAFNKIDKDVEKPLPHDEYCTDVLNVSAKTGLGVNNLIDSAESIVKSFKKSISVLIPYNMGHLTNIVFGFCEIIEQEHTPDGIFIKAYADNEICNRLNEFILKDE